MKITWFGHSAFRVETGKSVLLIDPFLSDNPVFGGSLEEAARGVTHVALTHGHGDHTGDAARICADTGATLIAVFEIAMHLNGQGAKNIEPANTGGTIYTEGATPVHGPCASVLTRDASFGLRSSEMSKMWA